MDIWSRRNLDPGNGEGDCLKGFPGLGLSLRAETELKYERSAQLPSQAVLPAQVLRLEVLRPNGLGIHSSGPRRSEG